MDLAETGVVLHDRSRTGRRFSGRLRLLSLNFRKKFSYSREKYVVTTIDTFLNRISITAYSRMSGEEAYPVWLSRVLLKGLQYLSNGSFLAYLESTPGMDYILCPEPPPVRFVCRDLQGYRASVWLSRLTEVLYECA